VRLYLLGGWLLSKDLKRLSVALHAFSVGFLVKAERSRMPSFASWIGESCRPLRDTEARMESTNQQQNSSQRFAFLSIPVVSVEAPSTSD